MFLPRLKRGTTKMSDLGILDTFGVPEFFYTTIGKTEPAGGGCIRIYCCIERNGSLIPQLTVVMPAMSLLVAARQAEEAALEVFNLDRIVGALAN